MGANVRVLKNDFSNGIVSPTLRSQINSEMYQKSVANIKNFIVTPDGGIVNRPGTHFLHEAKDVDDLVVMRTYIYSSEITYMLEFGPSYIRFYADDGSIIESGGSPYEVVTPYAEDELRELRFEQSGLTLYIAHVNHPTKILARVTNTSWTIADFSYINGPFMPLNSDPAETITPSATAIGASITLTSINNIFSNLTGSEHSSNKTLWQINEVIEGQALQIPLSAVGTTTNIKCGGTWRIVTHGSWTGTIAIEKSTDGGTTWSKIRHFSSVASVNVDTYGTEDGEQFLVRANAISWTSGTVVVDLSTDSFVWKGVAQITAVPAGGGGGDQMYNTATATVIETLSSTNATADWAEGSWSKLRGYPQAVAFFQDRLCLAGTVSESQTVWLSETGYYESFMVHSPIRDSDAISVIMASRENNTIRHLISLNELLILTSSSEMSLTSESGIITPTTIISKTNGKNGCSAISPVIVNNRVVYVDKNKTSLRDIGYSFEVNGFVGGSLTYKAKHLLKTRTIEEIAYQKEPYPIIWCICSDGLLLSFTYTSNGEVLAWSTHDTYMGNFKSLCVVAKSGHDELWFAVYRENLYRLGHGLGLMIIEKMLPRSTSNIIEDQMYMDCAIQTETTSITIVEIYANGFLLVPGHSYNNGDKIKLYNVNDRLNIGPSDSFYTVADSTPGYSFRLYYDGTTNYVQITAAEASAYTNSSGWCKDLVNEIVTGDYLGASIKFVDVMYDGQLKSETIEATGNKIIVDSSEASAYFTVGFRYDCICELLPPIIEMNDGVSIGRLYSITQALLRLNDSVGGRVGDPPVNPTSSVLQSTLIIGDDIEWVEELETDDRFGKFYDETNTKWIPDHYLTSGDGKSAYASPIKTDGNTYTYHGEPYPFEMLLVVMYVDIGGD